MIILIASSQTDAKRWSQRQPAPPLGLVIVTPRTPHMARGVKAVAVLATDNARRHPRFPLLLQETRPCTAWQRVAR